MPARIKTADLELLARGRTADVFAWKPGVVLKLYHKGFTEARTRLEMFSIYQAQAAGLRVPKAIMTLQIESRQGILLQRIDGETGMQRIYRSMHDLRHEAAPLVHIQAEITSKQASPIVPQRHLHLRRAIRTSPILDAPTQARLLKLLAKLPRGNRILHGDMHPNNVIWNSQGPWVIDWPDMSRGVPAADIARSLVLFGAFDRAWQPQTEEMAARQLYTQHYLDAALSRIPEAGQHLDQWILITAAARLSEGIVEDPDAWAAEIQSRLRALA